MSGGGLSAGIAAAIKALAPNARVIGVEPELAADAQESLAYFGLVKESHLPARFLSAGQRRRLTLARLRQPMDVVRWVRIFDGYEGPVWTADRIELISSRLGEGPSHGAAYDTVGEWEFLG